MDHRLTLHELQALLAVAQRKQRKATTKPTVDQAAPALGDGARRTFDERPKLHVVKEHQRRRVVRRTTSRCRDDGARTTPRSLPAPYERSKVTCDWLAWLVHQKFGLLTPLDRVRRDLAERGVPLAMESLVSFIERAADLLAPVDGVHWQQLVAGRWMATVPA